MNGRTDGRTDGQTNERTNERTKVPLFSTGLRALRGRCPKTKDFIELFIYTTQVLMFGTNLDWFPPLESVGDRVYLRHVEFRVTKGNIMHTLGVDMVIKHL